MVDVCVPHYNLGKYLGVLLESLEQQTFEAFSVTVIDDGSTDPRSVEAFEGLKRRYEPRGWRFIRTSNAGVCAARNAAARAGTAPYLIFMDADNVALPTMVGDFVSSIETSGDDCLTCHMYLFEGDGSPLQGFDAFGAPRPVPLVEMYVPVGNSKELGILSNPFGDGNFIMRRTVFEELGGFSDAWHRDVGVEDQELLTLASLSGYRLDVIPRALFFYRWREAGRNNTSDPFENQCRIASVYEERLRKVGLEGLASMILGLDAHAAALGARPEARARDAGSLESRRLRLWQRARTESRSSDATDARDAGSLRVGDIDFTRELKWIGSAPRSRKELTPVSACGETIPAMEMHPFYVGLPEDVSVSTRVSIPNDLREREIVFAAALDESGRGLGGGVALRFETLAGEPLGTLWLASTEQYWRLIAIKVPSDLPGGAMKITVEALASSNYCTTYVTVLGASKAGAEQRAGLSAWLSRSDHEPLDTIEGLNVGIPHGAIRGYDGEPLAPWFVDRDGVGLSAIHMHPGRPPAEADWTSLASVECVAETAGMEWLLLWTMPVVPEGLFRLVEVNFSLGDQHLMTRSFGSGFGENWKHVWLAMPEFRDPSELIITVSPLSVADYSTVFIALAGYRAVRRSNPGANGTLGHDLSRAGSSLTPSLGR
jgi:glycosyltransferase involved in cell wall biosynthesis